MNRAIKWNFPVGSRRRVIFNPASRRPATGIRRDHRWQIRWNKVSGRRNAGHSARVRKAREHNNLWLIYGWKTKIRAGKSIENVGGSTARWKPKIHAREGRICAMGNSADFNFSVLFDRIKLATVLLRGWWRSGRNRSYPDFEKTHGT